MTSPDPAAVTSVAAAPSVATATSVPTVAPIAADLAPAATVAKPAARPSRGAKSDAAPRTTPMATTPGSAGMIVGLDPETGVLGMPTDEQLKEIQILEDKVNWSTEGLEVVVHPGGWKSVDVKGRFAEYSVARIGADGKVYVDCVQGAAEANRLVNTPLPPAPAPAAEPEVQ